MHRWLPIPFFALVVLYFSHFAHARYAETVNGQQHTLGISIISAPAANSEYSAPGNLPVAIDVSGNGRISNEPTARMSSLELYLVSSNLNVTVSGSSARLINTEPGSTVKHVNFVLPDCLPAGNYNLTLYDTGTYENEAYFTITAVPLTLRSSSGSTSCNSLTSNRSAAQPQADSPLSFAPFAPGARAPKEKEEEGEEVPTVPEATPEPTISSDSSSLPTSTEVATGTQSSTTSDFTFPAQPTRSGSTSGFGVPQPSTDDQADEPSSGGITPSTETDDDPVVFPSDIPNMPAPVPEQVITIHGGFIVPVLSDSTLMLGPRVFFAAASAVLVSILL